MTCQWINSWRKTDKKIQSIKVRKLQVTLCESGDSSWNLASPSRAVSLMFPALQMNSLATFCIELIFSLFVPWKISCLASVSMEPDVKNYFWLKKKKKLLLLYSCLFAQRKCLLELKRNLLVFLRGPCSLLFVVSKRTESFGPDLYCLYVQMDFWFNLFAPYFVHLFGELSVLGDYQNEEKCQRLLLLYILL